MFVWMILWCKYLQFLYLTVAGEVLPKGSFICCGHGCGVWWVHQWLALPPWRNSSPKVLHFRLIVPIWQSWCPLSCAASSLCNCLTFCVLEKKNRPSYRKRKSSNSTEFSVRTNASVKGTGPSEAPAMLVPNLAPARSVREAIQEVKMVQVCSFHVIPFPSLSTVCMKKFQTHPWLALSP